MKIGHIAFWTNNLENMRDFYQTYFRMQCGEKYENVKRGFQSYFLSFDSGARIELMHRPDISDTDSAKGLSNGLAHIAISVGSIEAVNQLTERLRSDGYPIIGEPRTTGDGYYESVILDPEGNFVEIVG